MLQSFDCPVCSGKTWEPLRDERYLRKDIPQLKPYLQERYRILFEAWFGGRDEAQFTSVLCTSCGLVVFTPRPTEADIDRKYAIDVSLGRAARRPRPDNERVQKRALGIYKDVRRLVNPQSAVLDYGGDDGRLVLPFLRDGHQCYVVDYAPDAVQGVVRLGSTVADIEPQRSFDLLILGHVLEHVAEPLRLLSALRHHHAPGGILYVEVPMELWGWVPPGPDPVTHINYFTPPVLGCLLERAGYVPIRCELKWHRVRRRSLVVRAVARCSDGAPEQSARVPGFAGYTRGMLRASCWATLRVVAADWKRAPCVLSYTSLRALHRSLVRRRSRLRNAGDLA